MRGAELQRASGTGAELVVVSGLESGRSYPRAASSGSAPGASGAMPSCARSPPARRDQLDKISADIMRAGGGA